MRPSLGAIGARGLRNPREWHNRVMSGRSAKQQATSDNAGIIRCDCSPVARASELASISRAARLRGVRQSHGDFAPFIAPQPSQTARPSSQQKLGRFGGDGYPLSRLEKRPKNTLLLLGFSGCFSELLLTGQPWVASFFPGPLVVRWKRPGKRAEVYLAGRSGNREKFWVSSRRVREPCKILGARCAVCVGRW